MAFLRWRRVNIGTKSKDALKEIAERNEGYAESGALAVLVGLAVEIMLALGIDVVSHRMDKWATVAATVLIALGVLIEFHCGRKASDANRELASRSEKESQEIAERAALAEERAARANKEAARLRAHAAEVQRIMMPRVLYSGDDDSPLYAALAKFAGTKAIIFAREDGEPRDLARNIIGVLKQAKWDVQFFTWDRGFDGISIRGGENMPSIPPVPGAPPPTKEWFAAQALADLMSSQELGGFGPMMAMSEWPKNLRLYGGVKVPDGTVVVEVGLRPIRSELTALEHWGPLSDNPLPKWKME